MKTEIYENIHGLSFEVETIFIEKDQFGKPVNEWCVNERAMAKMYLYKDAKNLLPLEQENEAIEDILKIGMVNLLNSNFDA